MRDLVFTILGVDRGSHAFNAIALAADRAEQKLTSVGKVSAAALLGTVGASATAGVGIAAALGGAALAFGALGLAAASSNVKVQDSFNDLWDEIKTGTREAAEPLVPVLVGISDELSNTFDDIQPRLRRMFTDSIPAIESAVDGVTGFAREAMPGLERAVKASGPPMEGFRSLMIDAGRGSSQFFTSISTASVSSGRIIQVFGGVIRETLGITGALLARLSNDGAPAVERLGQAFTQALRVVDQLATGALPVLFGAAGAGLNVLSGLLTIVGGLSGALGPLAGVLVTTGAALKLLDAVSFGAVSVEFGRVKNAISEASGAGDKFRAGLSGLLGGIGPLALGAGALGLVLYGLGKAQERAAQDAAAHQQRVTGLADALRQSNGAINDNVRALAAKGLAEQQVGTSGKTVLQVARESGVSLNDLTSAYLGNADAQGKVNSQLDAFIAKMAVGEGADMSGALGIDEFAQRALDLKGMLPGLNSEYGTSAQKARDIAAAQSEAADATGRHSAAVMRLHDILLGTVNKDLAYRQAVHGEKEAHEAVADAITKHADAKSKAADATARFGAGSQAAKDAVHAEMEAQDALTNSVLSWEGAVTQGVAAAGALAESKYRGTDATEKSRLRQEAENQEIIRLAQLAGSDAPPALRQLIMGMDATALAALGVTVRVDETRAAVFRLPDGKEVRITGDNSAAKAAIDEINRYTIRDKTFTITQIVRVDRARNLSDPNAYAPGLAEGGPVRRGQLYVVGERGREFFVPSVDGEIIPHPETLQWERGGGSNGGSGPMQVNVVINGPVGSQRELQDWLTRAIDDLRKGGRL